MSRARLVRWLDCTRPLVGATWSRSLRSDETRLRVLDVLLMNVGASPAAIRDAAGLEAPPTQVDLIKVAHANGCTLQWRSCSGALLYRARPR
jgi:hypothetical protein